MDRGERDEGGHFKEVKFLHSYKVSSRALCTVEPREVSDAPPRPEGGVAVPVPVWSLVDQEPRGQEVRGTAQ